MHRRHAPPSSSLSNSVTVVPNAFPHGFSGLPRPARGHRVDLVDLVVGPVDLHVEPDVEEVLMERRRQAGGDHAGVVPRVAAATAIVDMIPGSFTSSCMVPSR